MNYKGSPKILNKIKGSRKILVNCHRSPDADSVGSALAISAILEELGKEVKIICPTEIGEDLKFLPFSEKIEKVDFKKFDFSNYDLFLILDTAGMNMLTGTEEAFELKIPAITIDHHKTNTKFADLNLTDPDISSTSELLYGLFEDWGVPIGKNTATCLFAGIVNDTGSFRYGNITSNTFSIAAKILDQGAEREIVLKSLFYSFDYKTIKLVGELINRSEVDENYKFIYSFLSFEDFNKFGRGKNARDLAVDFLVQTNDILFAMVMVEKEKRILSISLRSQGDFDVSKIALRYNGGGHRGASGGRIIGLKFDEAVTKALEIARKVSYENKS